MSEQHFPSAMGGDVGLRSPSALRSFASRCLLLNYFVRSSVKNVAYLRNRMGVDNEAPRHKYY